MGSSNHASDAGDEGRLVAVCTFDCPHASANDVVLRMVDQEHFERPCVPLIYIIQAAWPRILP